MVSDEVHSAVMAAVLAIAKHLAVLRMAALVIWQYYSRCRAKRLRYSYSEKMPRQVEHLKDLISDVNGACLDRLRINKSTFLKLCTLLRDYAHLKPTRYVTVKEMVAMFLEILAHHKKTREQKHIFKRSTWTVSKNFNCVLSAVLKLHDVLLKQATPINTTHGSSKFKYFENCLGALDGSYFHVRVKESEQPRFRDRHGNITTNVLGVCDDNMNFIYLLIGWEGSAADSRVLKDAISRRDAFTVRKGFYYLCDNGYANCEGFLAPFKGVRYHLKEWGVGSMTPQNHEEYFNMRHSSARNVIGRDWGLMKIRWGILRSASFYPIRTQNHIIMACALLHNFIRREMISDPCEAKVPYGYQNWAADDREFQDDISTLQSSSQWTTWSETYAKAMYEEWRQSRRTR